MTLFLGLMVAFGLSAFLLVVFLFSCVTSDRELGERLGEFCAAYLFFLVIYWIFIGICGWVNAASDPPGTLSTTQQCQLDGKEMYRTYDDEGRQQSENCVSKESFKILVENER